MPQVPDRQLSRGELYEKRRRHIVEKRLVRRGKRYRIWKEKLIDASNQARLARQIEFHIKD